MAWIKLIFLAFCLNSAAIHATENLPEDQGLEKAASDALKRCQQWIWKQTDPRTDFWAGGEVVTAIMGVLKDVIELRGLKYGNRTRLEGKDLVVVKPAEVQNAQSKIVAQNIEIAHLEFFKRLRNNGGEISEIPDDYLGQLAMVLGLTCLHDPKDYFGYNLIDELYNRAKKNFRKRLLWGRRARARNPVSCISDGFMQPQRFSNCLRGRFWKLFVRFGLSYTRRLG